MSWLKPKHVASWSFFARNVCFFFFRRVRTGCYVINTA